MAGKIPSQLIDDGSLYVSERKIYPRDVDGRFDRLRKAAVVWLLGMYYLFAWLPWEGRQAVLWDLPARKFYVFGLSFWPQDFLYLALLLIMAGLALFFFTALAGRLWCGYACPQTVWTEVFIWMERWAEGDRGRRMKLDAGPWSAEKIRKKLAKHAMWLAFALWTGFTFVGYFTPIRDLGARLLSLDWGGWETFWVLFYALATWGNAGVLREQVCKYMCPYARFQSAMFDRNTLIIAYDEARGEPRGPKSTAVGDCIDCTICVQVCPTGIDIRNGLQYECIACGACIDACNQVMDRVGYPRGLIRYTTQNAVDGRPARILRPRIYVYGVLLLALLAGFIAGIATRNSLIVDVIRDRNALYRIASDNSIENGYTLRLVNKDAIARQFRVRIEGAPQLSLVEADSVHAAKAEEVLTLPLTVRAPAGAVKGRLDLEFVVESDDGALKVVEETRFFGPF